MNMTAALHFTDTDAPVQPNQSAISGYSRPHYTTSANVMPACTASTDSQPAHPFYNSDAHYSSTPQLPLLHHIPQQVAHFPQQLMSPQTLQQFIPPAKPLQPSHHSIQNAYHPVPHPQQHYLPLSSHPLDPYAHVLVDNTISHQQQPMLLHVDDREPNPQSQKQPSDPYYEPPIAPLTHPPPETGLESASVPADILNMPIYPSDHPNVHSQPAQLSAVQLPLHNSQYQYSSPDQPISVVEDPPSHAQYMNNTMHQTHYADPNPILNHYNAPTQLQPTLPIVDAHNQQQSLTTPQHTYAPAPHQMHQSLLPIVSLPQPPNPPLAPSTYLNPQLPDPTGSYVAVNPALLNSVHNPSHHPSVTDVVHLSAPTTSSVQPDILPNFSSSTTTEMFDSYLAVGRACRDLGRYDLAADAFRACMAICPESSEARQACMSTCYGNGYYDINVPQFASSLELGPVFPEDIFNDIGNALRAMGRTSEAELAYRSALDIAPRHAHAWNNLGNAMRARGAISDAMSCYSASLSVHPGFAAAHCNLAGLLRDQGKPQEAEGQYRAALMSDPNLAEAAAGLGTALRDMGRTEEAVGFYVRAVRLQPDASDHHANLANTYKDLNRIEESIVSYQRALSIKPDLPDTFCNMVHSLSVICDWRNRDQHFTTLLSIIDRQLDTLLRHPGTHPTLYRTLVGALSNSTPQLVDVFGGSRSDRDNASVSASTSREDDSSDRKPRRRYVHHPSSPTVFKKARMRGKFGKFLTNAPSVVAPVLTSGLPSVQPFHALIYPMSPEKFRALSAAYASRAESMVAGIPHVTHRWSPPNGQGARLKVGYVSSDYNNHPYSHLTQSIYGLHGKGSVECYCYALTPSDQSTWRLRIEREAEHFRDISAMSAKQSAEAIAHDGIHVLVNCNGYTKGARTELFALRPAPVQVSFMGFPGTLGAHYIEYFITDVVTSPPNLASRMHSEALLYHPHSYFVNDHRQTSIPGPSAHPSGALTRAHYGLPENCFLFIMHNQLYKLSPDTFDVWARILKRVPGSKLWLLRFPPTAERRIREEAADRGLEAERLIFTDVAGKEEHVARAGLGDLFLDTPTCNAHTTGTDALWSGVPMVTCPGSLFASRVAASLLTAAGVPELIASDMNEYEDLAVELATNRPRLAAIRARIESTRYKNALFDTERWVRNVEALYWGAWRNFENGKEPSHIFGKDIYDGSTMLSKAAALDSVHSTSDSRRSETPMYRRTYSSTVAT